MNNTSHLEFIGKLRQYLSKNFKGRIDQVYIENDYIIVKVSRANDSLNTKNELVPIINAFMIDENANRVAVKIINGFDVDILAWGF